MASKQHNSGGDSSTAVSISPPDDDEKEIEEDNKDLEKSIPPEKENKSSDHTQPTAVTDWDGPNDPDNPQTWSYWKKAYHILVPTILGFVVSVSLVQESATFTDGFSALSELQSTHHRSMVSQRGSTSVTKLVSSVS